MVPILDKPVAVELSFADDPTRKVHLEGDLLKSASKHFRLLRRLGRKHGATSVYEFPAGHPLTADKLELLLHCVVDNNAPPAQVSRKLYEEIGGDVYGDGWGALAEALAACDILEPQVSLAGTLEDLMLEEWSMVELVGGGERQVFCSAGMHRLVLAACSGQLVFCYIGRDLPLVTKVVSDETADAVRAHILRMRSHVENIIRELSRLFPETAADIVERMEEELDDALMITDDNVGVMNTIFWKVCDLELEDETVECDDTECDFLVGPKAT